MEGLLAGICWIKGQSCRYFPGVGPWLQMTSAFNLNTKFEWTLLGLFLLILTRTSEKYVKCRTV